MDLQSIVVYFSYIDETQSARILADAIKESYSDLFALNTHANEMTVVEVKNKLKTLFQGAKSEDVLKRIATTFVGLCTLADFSSPNNQQKDNVSVQVKPERKNLEDDYSRVAQLNGLDNLEPLMNKQLQLNFITTFSFIYLKHKTYQFMMLSLKALRSIYYEQLL